MELFLFSSINLDEKSEINDFLKFLSSSFIKLSINFSLSFLFSYRCSHLLELLLADLSADLDESKGLKYSWFVSGSVCSSI